MIHVFTNRISRVAGQVEREFFRIEERNGWLACLMNGLIAGCAVALVEWLVSTRQEGDLLLFACLGSSAASVVFAPLAKNNSLRSIVLAYGVCCGVCLGLYALRLQLNFTLPVQCFLAVTLAIFLMRWMEAMHPAAVGSALAFIIYERDMQSLMILMLAILGLLVIVKVLAYTYRKELAFKTFSREFRKDYYGEELTLTLVNPQTEQQIEAVERPAE